MKAELDITQNIRVIEKLKVKLLEGVATLYADMLKPGTGGEDRIEVLAGIMATTYLLSAKLGINYTELDENAVKRLRLDLIEADGNLNAEIHALLMHLKAEENIDGQGRASVGVSW